LKKEANMAELSVKCSTCGHVLTADSEEEMIKAIQAHAKEKHNMEMSEEKAKESIKMGHTV
jgi:predicted small metal-binding protein